MSKTVIITGGLGFIGRNIAQTFKENNYYVIGICSYGDIQKESLKSIDFGKWFQESISIENLKKIERKADTIIHCAGGSTVGISIVEPYLDYNKTDNSPLNC